MIRLLENKDLDKVEEIEKECFTDPWSKLDFLVEMSDLTGNLFVLVENDVIGYIDYHLIDNFAEIYNIAVKTEMQGKGYGQILLDFMFEKCKGKVDRIFLEVRTSNPAQNLYRRNGFTVNRIRKNYYGNEDAIEMVKELK